jgi:hypothetical protein
MVMLRLLLVAGCQNGPMSTRRRPPAGLDGPGRAFWRSGVAVYDLAPAEFTLLAQACAVVDLLALADAELKADGLTVTGSVGQLRAHPHAIQRAAGR